MAAAKGKGLSECLHTTTGEMARDAAQHPSWATWLCAAFVSKGLIPTSLSPQTGKTFMAAKKQANGFFLNKLLVP